MKSGARNRDMVMFISGGSRGKADLTAGVIPAFDLRDVGYRVKEYSPAL